MAYIDAKDVSKIRKALKDKYGKSLKFSVRCLRYSTVSVALISGEYDFAAAGFDLDGRTINAYHPDSAEYGKYAKLFTDIVKIIKGDSWYDRSDIMTDYFDTAYYIDLSIGRYDKPYVFTG